MKLKRLDVLQAHQGLSALERGHNGKQFDFSWETWGKVFNMLSCLQPAVDAYNKARQQRFMTASGGKQQIEDQEAAGKFAQEEEAAINATVSIKMPKQKITEAELKLTENVIPPTVRVQISPVVQWVEKPSDFFDEDENEY